ncbi:hypothetical protein KGF56_001385 [Candida oxycetoniae]|uniref:Endoplasmic reticulum membrane protein n=1 Tax=Candida oxycetoniae TaxID=497107 RepID=A0AAI9SZ24_9ASCO|nr:uncharacterized protein KGF56_001385 [Candida oxycetoniae]KAI3405778.1 hypothetical protein KGF56_001385 [Candida oxycetoniae]
MAGLFALEDHLVFYRSYHFNKTNVTIHLICIPIILLSAITFLMPVTFPRIFDSPQFNLGNFVAWSYGLYYIALDWKVGLPSATILVTYAHFIRNYYSSLSANTSPTSDFFIKCAIGIHVVAWFAQFYGHGIHEKRAPALLDNLLQALVLAPFFVAFEIAFVLGYKLDLKKSMDNRAGKIVRDFKAKGKR